MKVSNALAANLALATISVDSYNFRVLGASLSDFPPSGLDETNSVLGAFQVSTDAAGQIVDWDIELFTLDTTLITENTPGDVSDFIFVSSEGVGAQNFNNAGTWTSTVPEPSSLILLSGFILAWGLITRRRVGELGLWSKQVRARFRTRFWPDQS